MVTINQQEMTLAGPLRRLELIRLSGVHKSLVRFRFLAMVTPDQQLRSSFRKKIDLVYFNGSLFKSSVVQLTSLDSNCFIPLVPSLSCHFTDVALRLVCTKLFVLTNGRFYYKHFFSFQGSHRRELASCDEGLF